MKREYENYGEETPLPQTIFLNGVDYCLHTVDARRDTANNSGRKRVFRLMMYKAEDHDEINTLLRQNRNRMSLQQNSLYRKLKWETIATFDTWYDYSPLHNKKKSSNGVSIHLGSETRIWNKIKTGTKVERNYLTSLLRECFYASQGFFANEVQYKSEEFQSRYLTEINGRKVLTTLPIRVTTYRGDERKILAGEVLNALLITSGNNIKITDRCMSIDIHGYSESTMDIHFALPDMWTERDLNIKW